MNRRDRTRLGVILERWAPYFIIACTFIGAVIGSFLVYIFQGEFPFIVLISGFLAAIFLVILEVIKQKYKNKNLPEADERVTRNIFHFFAYVSHISLAIIFISLGIFTLLGNESFPILYLWIFFFSYIWIVGLGALIVKKR